MMNPQVPFTCWQQIRRVVAGHVAIGLLGGLSVGCGGEMAEPITGDDKNATPPATVLPPATPSASSSPSNGTPDDAPKDWVAIARNNGYRQHAEVLEQIERDGAAPDANRKEYLVRKAAELGILCRDFERNGRQTESLNAAKAASDLSQEFQQIEGKVSITPDGFPFRLSDVDVARGAAINYVAAAINFGSNQDREEAFERALGSVEQERLHNALPWLKDRLQDPELMAMVEKYETQDAAAVFADVTERLGGEKFSMNFPSTDASGDEFLISDYQGKYVIVVVSRDGKLPITAGVGAATIKESLGDSANLILVDVEDAGRDPDLGFNIVAGMLPTLHVDLSFLETLPADLALPALVMIDKEGNGRMAVPLAKIPQLIEAVKATNEEE